MIAGAIRERLRRSIGPLLTPSAASSLCALLPAREQRRPMKRASIRAALCCNGSAARLLSRLFPIPGTLGRRSCCNKVPKSRRSSDWERLAPRVWSRMPPPCKFFQVGACTAGASCRFSHERADSPLRLRTLCKFYAQGYCANGDACPFSHEKAAARRGSVEAARGAAVVERGAGGGSPSLQPPSPPQPPPQPPPRRRPLASSLRAAPLPPAPAPRGLCA